MADLPSGFWAGWVAVITLTSLAGLVWLVFSVYFTPGDEHGDGEGPVWDSNLREGSSPAPMWWFWLILSTMVFSVIYLMLYPGLGSYQGALRWSQGGRLDQSLAQYQAEFGGVRALVAEAQVATLQSDPDMMASAQRVFDRVAEPIQLLVRRIDAGRDTQSVHLFVLDPHGEDAVVLPQPCVQLRRVQAVHVQVRDAGREPGFQARVEPAAVVLA